jgi:PAT family beta-lactamase induction signal transducer AmpG
MAAGMEKGRADAAPGDQPAAGSGNASSRPALWVSSTYFAEGFPYSVVNNLVEILFKELGASLQLIGLTALFHLPWNLKFLWGPFLDEYETKRAWIIAIEVALSVVMLALALLVGATPLFGAISLCVALLAFLSATHDIAIDGYYLEGLAESEQSRYVGYRAAAYRVAGLAVSSPLLLVIGAAGWRTGLLVAAATMIVLTVGHAVLLPHVERRRAALRSALARPGTRRALGGLIALVTTVLVAALLARDTAAGEMVLGAIAADSYLGISLAGWISLALLLVLIVALGSLGNIRRRLAGRDSPYATAFIDFLAQRRIALVLVFIVSFRVGESFLVKMRWPFLHDDIGMTLAEYAFANGTVGTIASFAATFLGGHLIARDGLRRWIWPFVLAQNGLHLLYVALAHLGASAGMAATVTVITVEQIGSGLGTAVFMVYLMRCCSPAHRAAHMAIVTALMSVSFTLAGVCSGFLASWLGFGPYFAFTFVVTIPGMALVFFLPHLDGREEHVPHAGSAAPG